MIKSAGPDRHEITVVEETRIQAGIAADPDNPEWTEDDFARARPAQEILPQELFTALTRPRGRPKADATKTPVKLRLDPAVLDQFKAGGPGWQTRMNRFLSVHDLVIRMIEEHERAVCSMRGIIQEVKENDLEPDAVRLGTSIERTRRNLDIAAATITDLRALLGK